MRMCVWVCECKGCKFLHPTVVEPPLVLAASALQSLSLLATDLILDTHNNCAFGKRASRQEGERKCQCVCERGSEKAIAVFKIFAFPIGIATARGVRKLRTVCRLRKRPRAVAKAKPVGGAEGKARREGGMEAGVRGVAAG